MKSFVLYLIALSIRSARGMRRRGHAGMLLMNGLLSPQLSLFMLITDLRPAVARDVKKYPSEPREVRARESSSIMPSFCSSSGSL